MSAAGGALDRNQGNGVLEDNAWGTDTFRINSTLALEDFPIGVARTTSLFTEVGLARNSTLVDALYAKGAIGSKSWGLSMGWQGADPLHQADGSLVLGGYDIAKTNGNNSTYPISGDNARGDCPGGLVVTIRDIVLNQKNGSSPSILPSSAGSVLQACIDPAFSVLQFPSDIYETFLDNTYSPLVADTYRSGRARSTGVNFWGMLFAAEDVYDGDMTVTISPGLDIRIPNHQLVSPDYHFDAEGSLTEPNSTVRELLFNSLQVANANDMPVLGRPFLASSYLFVDNDRQAFTLWPGNPTATEEEIIPVGAISSCNPDIGTEIPPAASPTTGSNDNATNKSINNGAVAGIVVGSVTGLVIFSFILIRFLRAAQPRRTTSVSNPEKVDDQLPSYLALKAEMPTDRQPPQELPVERDPGGAVPSSTELEQEHDLYDGRDQPSAAWKGKLAGRVIQVLIQDQIATGARFLKRNCLQSGSGKLVNIRH
ncbi:MAG: hypothetical protein Q9208_001914 [Pyrenodesmia sp. 3 TL-2023]